MASPPWIHDLQAPPANKRKRGGRRAQKAIVDDRQDIQIPLREMQGWIRDTSDLLRDPSAAAAADKPAAIDFGPATAVPGSVGAWPPELMEIYNRGAVLGGVHKAAEEEGSEEEEEEGRAGRFGGAYTEDPMLPGAEYVGQSSCCCSGRTVCERPAGALPRPRDTSLTINLHVQPTPADYGDGGMMPEGDPMAMEYGAYGGLDPALDAGRASNPFRRAAREPRASADPSDEGFDIETER